jgi:hypothetical protein
MCDLNEYMRERKKKEKRACMKQKKRKPRKERTIIGIFFFSLYRKAPREFA